MMSSDTQMKLMQRAASLFLIVLLASCGGSSKLDPQSYLAFMERNSVREIVTEQAKYKVRLIPPAYFAIKEGMQSDGKIDRKSCGRRLQEWASNTYFIVEVANSEASNQFNGSNPEVKANVISYYQHEAAKHFSLKVGESNVLEPSYVNYEDNFGLSPVNRIVVCFNYNLAAVSDELILSYDDALNNVPGINAAFSVKEIKNLPTPTL